MGLISFGTTTQIPSLFCDKAMRIILAFLSLLVISSLAEEKTEEFNLRPGAPDRVSTTVDGVTCDFHYKTSGGTSELWIMTLKKSGGDVTCTISR
jgi:hypothetical protein